MLKDTTDAYDLLLALGAPDRLVRHAELVCRASRALLLKFRAMGVACDGRLVELGAALHDAGKIVHPGELSGPGFLHEQAGLALLLEHDVQMEVARCCVSHGAWDLPEVSFEERTVALADKLWKGKRESELELVVVDEVARRLGISRWDAFEELDNTFEEIAAGGAERIEGSRPDR